MRSLARLSAVDRAAKTGTIDGKRLAIRDNSKRVAGVATLREALASL
jgi:hypothetical protein